MGESPAARRTRELVAFVEARHAEDESGARAALWAGDERWRTFRRGGYDRWVIEDSQEEGVEDVNV